MVVLDVPRPERPNRVGSTLIAGGACGTSHPQEGTGLSLVAVRGLLEAAGRVVVSPAVATSVPAAGVGVIAARVPLSVGIVEAAPARARAGGGGGGFWALRCC